MDQQEIIRMAGEAGITPWVKMEWSNNLFVSADEGMDGDLACLMQFAALVAAAEREACLRACEEMIYRDPGRVSGAQCTAAIRARGEK